MKIHLSIDPGVTLGWAAWRMATFQNMDWPLAGGICGKDKGSWQARCDAALSALRGAMADGSYKVESVTIEYPTYMQGQGGQLAARRGDLVKLAYMAGRIHEFCRAEWGADVRPVDVVVWKGQLPKGVVANRAVYIMADALRIRSDEVHEGLEHRGFSDSRSHDWDALAMGLWAKGFFK